MGTNSLAVQFREIGSKGQVRQIRKEGLTPGVVYGGEKPTIPIKFNYQALERLLSRSGRGRNTLIELEIPGASSETVMIREFQWEPVSKTLLHADFYRISLSEHVQIDVQLIWIGEPQGVKEGGLLQPGLRSVQVECLPNQIPEGLEVSVAELGIGDKLTVADLVTSPGIKILNDPDEVVVSILSGRIAEEPEAEEEAPAEEERPEETQPETTES